MSETAVRKFAAEGSLCATTLRHAWPHDTDEERKRRAMIALGWGFSRQGRWTQFLQHFPLGKRYVQIISTLSLEGTLALAVGYLDATPPQEAP